MEGKIKNILDNFPSKTYKYEILVICDFYDYRNRMSKNFIKFFDFVKANIQDFKITYVGTDIPNFNKGIDIFTLINKYATFENIIIYICDVRAMNLITRLDEYYGIKIFDFEDMGGKVPIITGMVNKYGFDYVLYKSDCELTNKIIKGCPNAKFYRYDHYIDESIFKDYNLDKKYDILCYGCTDFGYYPFRKRLFNLVKNNPEFNTFFIEHPNYGYKIKHNIVGEELAKVINQSKITLTCSSILEILLKRYIEVPLSKSCLAGDVPKYNGEKFKDCMIELTPKMTDREIIEKLKYYLDKENENKLNELTEKSQKICKDHYTYQAGTKRMYEIFSEIIEDYQKKNGNELNKINQIYISNDLGKFDLVMRKKYNLNAYHNSNKPAFFFGLYNQVDFGIISNHKSTAVIIWGGTDAQMIHNWDLKRISYFFPGDIKMLSEENKNIWKKIIETHEPSLIDKIDLNHVQIEMKENIPIKFYNLLFKDNIRYLAISNNIAESLEKLNLSYKRANISFVDVDKFSPVEKGDSVYIYTSNNCPDIYGKEIYDVVKKKMPTTKFIICNSSTYDDIFEIYKKCFIGLRLTSHDGNANTVQELGLCGIKCVHNSDYPNAIPWSCVDDIVKIVEMEKKNIGKKDDELAMRMKEYLKTYNNDWLCKSFYD